MWTTVPTSNNANPTLPSSLLNCELVNSQAVTESGSTNSSPITVADVNKITSTELPPPAIACKSAYTGRTYGSEEFSSIHNIVYSEVAH